MTLAADPQLAAALEADRQLAKEITPAYSDADAAVAVRAAGARHNARIDAPELGKKGWTATARGVTADAQQQRHPWTVTGTGTTADEALRYLMAQLDGRPVQASAEAVCSSCGRPL